MIIKDLLYFVLLIFLYRTFFRPKNIVQHNHYYEKKNNKPAKPKNEDYSDYEEIS